MGDRRWEMGDGRWEIGYGDRVYTINSLIKIIAAAKNQKQPIRDKSKIYRFTIRP